MFWLGTEEDIFRERKAPPKSIKVHDESTQAGIHAQKELPASAPYLRTRLLPSVDPVGLE